MCYMTNLFQQLYAVCMHDTRANTIRDHTLTLTRTHARSPSHSPAPALALTPTLMHQLALTHHHHTRTHTHTHTHTHTRTHTHTHAHTHTQLFYLACMVGEEPPVAAVLPRRISLDPISGWSSKVFAYYIYTYIHIG